MAKIERTKNATKNVIFGVILRLYQIIVPFVMRTLMIYFMGVQYVGLNSLFTSILQFLNLAELGVGSAMVYSMYKPIAEDDDVAICALMNLYRKYYRIIGIIIAVVGCCFTPFIPKMISGDIPADINIYALYLLNLGATVLSYWLFAYKNSILLAHQKTDLISKVTLVANTIQYIFQIVSLIVFKNYYLYVILLIAGQILINILTAGVVNRKYPNFKPRGVLHRFQVKEINQRVRDLFTAKIGGTITNSADTIVISSFLGLTTLAVYQNYYFIMNAICSFISVFLSSIVAGVGNSLITESREKNLKDFRKLTFLICFVICICCSCFIGLFQPFIKIWVGEDLLLDFKYVVLFCILFYWLELGVFWATIKDAAGLWHSDRFRPLIGSIFNLILNIILVQYVGLYGVMISTILSYILILMPWLLHNLFTQVYKESWLSYLKDMALYIVVTIVSCFFTHIICGVIKCNGISELLIKGIISVIIPVVIQILLFFRKNEFQDSINLVKKIVKR